MVVRALCSINARSKRTSRRAELLPNPHPPVQKCNDIFVFGGVLAAPRTAGGARRWSDDAAGCFAVHAAVGAVRASAARVVGGYHLLLVV